TVLLLVGLLTFIVTGLANGLSRDNSALIEGLPQGHFYMSEQADRTYSYSTLEPELVSEVLSSYPEALALSIQMGFFTQEDGKQIGVALATSTGGKLLPEVRRSKLVLDRSAEEKGIEVGDVLTNETSEESFQVTAFADGMRFSHAPVAFLQVEDYRKVA